MIKVLGLILLGCLTASAQPPEQPKIKDHLSGMGGIGQKSPRRPLPGQLPQPAASPVNYEVEISAKYQELEHATKFVIGDGAQANQVAGGEKAYAVKGPANSVGVEFKKWGFIVNLLPTAIASDPKSVSIQMQLELSGPVKSATSALDVPDISTWQYQSTFTLEKGRKTLVVTAPARVEISIVEAK